MAINCWLDKEIDFLHDTILVLVCLLAFDQFSCCIGDTLEPISTPCINFVQYVHLCR